MIKNYTLTAVLLFFSNTWLNAQTIDVDFTGISGSCGSYIGLSETQTLGQSFTANLSGNLTSVNVGIAADACTETAIMNCVATVYDGTCTGTVLTTENFSIPTGSSLSMYPINFSNPANISSGQTYTLELSVVAGQDCALDPFSGMMEPVFGRWTLENAFNCGGEYAGGTAYEPGCSSYPGDFYIQTIVSTNATGIDTRTECNSYTWIDGVNYTSSNNSATFNIVGGSSNGCDSLVTLDLTIVNSTSGIDTRTECNSFTWLNGNTYTANNNSATFNIVGGAVNGCDSLVTLDLTINSVSDLTTTTSGISISSNNTGATYQWLDCDNNNSLIVGETGQSFVATINGNYAVELTENGCVDTTACAAITTVGILENNFGNALIIYPNPTSGNFSIDLGTIYESSDVSIMDINGKLIYSKIINQSKILNLSIEEPVGVYLISIKAADKKAVIRLVKE